MPVGGALDGVPVDLTVLLDIGQPRDFRVLPVTVLRQRMHPRRAETAAEGGNIGGAALLIAGPQDGVCGEGALDPGEGPVVEARQIDTERFRTECLAERTNLRRTGHGRTSRCSLPPTMVSTAGAHNPARPIATAHAEVKRDFILGPSARHRACAYFV